MQESLPHDLAIVWIVFGLVALLGLVTSWITIATVNRKYDIIHTFVASLVGSRFLYCVVPLLTVSVMELSSRTWGVIECQLVYWAWTAACLADLITVTMALLFTLTSCIPGCLRIRKLAVDVSVSLAWLFATVTAGIMSLVHQESSAPQTCTLLPHAEEYKLGVALLVFYFGGGVLIVFLGSGAAAYLTIYKYEQGTTVPSTHTNGSLPATGVTSSHQVHTDRNSVPCDQTSAILNVSSSLTALLSLIPQSVVLSIGLLRHEHVPFGQHIILGTALLHSLALPVSLPLISRDYSRALLGLFKRDLATSTIYGGIDNVDGTRTSVSSPPDTLDLRVPDIVVCDITASAGHENNGFDESDDVTGNERLPKVAMPPGHWNGSKKVRRTTTTVLHQNPPRILKRSQSQQTRREWVQMMQRTFLPHLRYRNKPDIISNHVIRASSPGNKNIENDGEEDDEASYDYDDIEEVLDHTTDTDMVQESEKDETDEVGRITITNSNIDVSKYVVDKEPMSSDTQNDTTGEHGENSLGSESGTLPKNKISTNPRHRGQVYNDNDNYFSATLKRQLLLKDRSISFKENNRPKLARKPQSSSESPPCSSRESSFKSTQSSSSTVTRAKHDPFSTEWTQAFMRTHGVGRHSSRLSHERPGLSRKLSRLESFHGTLRREQTVSRQPSSTRSLLNRSPRPRHSSHRHVDTWRHRDSSARRFSRDTPVSDCNPFLADQPFLSDYRDMYFPHSFRDRYIHEMAILHSQLARPYALTPYPHLSNPYLLSQPTLDIGFLDRRAYPTPDPPFLTSKQDLHKQYSMEESGLVGKNPFLNHGGISDDMNGMPHRSAETNPFREYMQIENPPVKPSNPFYMDTANEIYEDIEFPPVTPKENNQRPQQNEAKPKVMKSKWRKPSLSRSIVDFLRSRSFKLSVLDNGEKVSSKTASEQRGVGLSSKDIASTSLSKEVEEPSNYKLQEDRSIEVEDEDGMAKANRMALAKSGNVSLPGDGAAAVVHVKPLSLPTDSKTVYQSEYL